MGGGDVQDYSFIQTHIFIPNTFLIALKFNILTLTLNFWCLLRCFSEIPTKSETFWLLICVLLLINMGIMLAEYINKLFCYFLVQKKTNQPSNNII